MILSRRAVKSREHNSRMGTAILIPVEEYLHTSYRPDRDFVDGEVQERNLGEEWHSSVQSMIASIFKANRHHWGLRSYTEQRVQVSPTRFRIPDVCVVPATKPMRGILRDPPVLCVEVLSPEDRFARILERVREYVRMGVPNVWIVDPISREIWTANAQGDPVLSCAEVLALPGTVAAIHVAEIFAEIDEAPQAPEA